MKTISIITLIFICPTIAWAIKILPNAPFSSGFGIDTVAGSGRSESGTPVICKVVNLNDTGTGIDTDDGDGIVTGDFRYCATGINGPKVIVFEVSGYIEMTDTIQLDEADSYMTIAGQTAPSPGITFRGYNFYLNRNLHDVLIQHIRFAHGDYRNDTKYESWDNMVIDDHYVEGSSVTPYNIVIDHCSFRWAEDETLQNGGNQITFINNIFSEALSCSRMDDLPVDGVLSCHSKGPYISYAHDNDHYANDVALIYNLMAYNADRNPGINGGTTTVANNLIVGDGWGINAWDNASISYKTSIVGNYLDRTLNANYCMYIKAGLHESTRVYIDGTNYFDGQIQAVPWDINEVTSCFEQREDLSDSGSNVPLINRASSSSETSWPTGFVAKTAAESRLYVLKNAGARPADRDVVDKRIITESTTNSGQIIDSVTLSNSDCTADGAPMECCTGEGAGDCVQNAEQGYPTLAENTRTLTIPDNPHVVQASGYTALEEWLQGYATDVEVIVSFTANKFYGTMR